MFGEDLLIGNKNVGIDEKSRIYLPPFTKAEENDILALVNTIDQVGKPKIKVYLLKKYREVAKKLQELQKNATSIDEYLRYEKEIVSICSTIYLTLKVDKQRRILIPEDLMVENYWTKRSSLYCEGKGNYITLK